MGSNSSKQDNDQQTTSHSCSSNICKRQKNNTRPIMEKIDYKARFERKMCLAKETPEPDFDLSECNLKEIPPGVFIHCRILRKETLNLSNNKLTIFSNINGGKLSDLELLTIVNLNYNNIKKLPDEINHLQNLRELLISNNNLVQLPSSIKSLNYLTLLDVSYNKLNTINEVNCMSRLQILNISGNIQLKELPKALSTCDSLNNIIFDIDYIEWPTKDVLEAGTKSIMRFLTMGEKGEMGNCSQDDDETDKVKMDTDVLKETKEDALLSDLANRGNTQLANRNLIKMAEQYYGNEDALIEELHLKQQKQKEEMLKLVMTQQNETELLVNQVQQQKDEEKKKLIKDIIETEENANIIIEKFLLLKNSIDIDHILLENERLEEEKLLEKVQLEHADLRKQEILATMSEILIDEEAKLQIYQQIRDETSNNIKQREQEFEVELEQLYRDYEKNRSEIIDKINENEDLQKQAVISLVEKNDARSWSLIEQLKIIEMQLASLTQFEIEKKKNINLEQMNDLTDKRIRLTCILSDLLSQKEQRKAQLLDTLLALETQKENEQEDFWLLQYQKLLDSGPLDFSIKTNSIDPLLGYNFLVNGVIHCLPFLQKLWKNTDLCLEKINEDDLKSVGIYEEKDRRLILKSIKEFLTDEIYNTKSSATIILPLPDSSEDEEKCVSEEPEDKNNPMDISLSECVICMEQTVKFIFLPCGHLCCCSNCQSKVEICPMCRADIERKVKIIHS